MTVQVSDRLSQLYVGNGINTRFDFTFRAFEQEDETGIGVRVKIGNEFEFIDEDKYSVTLNPDNFGGFVTFIDAPDATTYFYIAGKTPVDQLLDITNYDNFYPDAIERALDKLTAILQEWKHLVDFETQARILADIDYDALALQREADLKAYIDGIASAITGKPVLGLPTDFVVDGPDTQKQINDRTVQYVDSVASLRLLKPRHNYAVAETTSFYSDTFSGRNRFKWDAANTTDDNGYSIIKVNNISIGRWRMIDDDSITSSQVGVRDSSNSNQLLLNKLIFQFKEFKFINKTIIDDTLVLNSNDVKYTGSSTQSEIFYAGGAGASGALKSIVKTFKENGNAVSNIKLSDLKIAMNRANYTVGFDARYLTNESLIDRLKITGIADTSVGIYLTKCWYSKFRQCMVSGYSDLDAPNRHGIGIYIDSLIANGAQVNAVEFDVKCHSLNYGYLINPQNYIYGLNLLNMATIENCNFGIKVKGSTADLSVRQSVISQYFENNTVDIEWGDETNQRALASQHTWLSCSFDNVHSTIKLWEGSHVFIGCKGVVNLTIGANASVRFVNTPAPTGVVTNLGSDNYFVESNAKTFITSGTYRSGSLPPGAMFKRRFRTTNTSTTFDISKAFSSASFTEGQTAEIRLTSRRDYDLDVKEWRGTLWRKPDGNSFLVKLSETTGLTVSIVGDILTVSDGRGDSKTYELIMHID
ncbi:hypothetical protein [Acinetobacter baumannii]|uniref:Uncharacterized protein n=1 Tax=Acinetobacter baumannii TaxID=470 RepID=A0A8B5UIF3_ACIBA|nr:hypothetical protein [Acinetobacter baumannii]MBV6560240.1 hypothetical protein [Acinetobacter baumannii]TPU61324.1 hypothetical protein FJU42_16125 [Acinetobacter baumannii]